MRSLFRRHAAEHQIDDATRRLVERTRYELVPMKGVEEAVDALPPGSPVSVTCSPVKGLPATLDLTARLLDLGHDAVPHFAARVVEGPSHVAELARWLRDHGVRELFVIGGDAEQPQGPYVDGLSFLRELLDHDTGLRKVGVPGYPDSHPLIDATALRNALHDKQALFEEVGIAGSVTTQMCFDTHHVRSWLHHERKEGLVLPIDLGVPGVVERAKLMTMGVRLGVGASLRFLRKNRSTVMAMLAPGGYDPTDLVVEIAEHADELDITGLHSFTFNRVATTRAWQERLLKS